MNILLLGTTGYTGPYLTQKLMKAGHHVVTVNRRYPATPSHKDYIVSNLETSSEIIERIIMDEGIDTLVNLVWAGSYGPNRNSRELQESNIPTNMMLAKLASKHEVHFITTGTISEYILKENGEHTTEYGRAKAKLHEDLINFTLNCELKFTYAVLGNVFGGVDLTNRFVINSMSKMMNDEEIKMGTNGEQLFYPLYIDDFTSLMTEIIEEGHTGTLVLTQPALKLKDFLFTMKDTMESNSAVSFGENTELTVKITPSFTPETPLHKAINESYKLLKEAN